MTSAPPWGSCARSARVSSPARSSQSTGALVSDGDSRTAPGGGRDPGRRAARDARSDELPWLRLSVAARRAARAQLRLHGVRALLLRRRRRAYTAPRRQGFVAGREERSPCT